MASFGHGGSMTRTHTRLIDYQRLEARGKSSVLVIKLMMACNDMQLANEAASNWKEDQPRNRQYRQTGARMYFIRLQMAHLHEALKIVEEIRNDDPLMVLLFTCDSQTQASFRKLEACLKGGTNRALVEKIIGQVRHNLTFHYDETGKQIERAISAIAAIPGGHHAHVTRGSNAYLWHFEAGDEVMDKIIVRYIWRIPSGANLREEADAIAHQMHEIFLTFVDFAGELIWKFSSP